MAAGDRIGIADKKTLDAVKANTDGILKAVQDSDGSMKGKRVYGFKINKADSNPATRISYVYDAVGLNPAKMNFSTSVFDYGDWADKWFVRDNYPCMVKYNGVEDYKLNPNDYTKKADGTASDVANVNYGGNAMAAIPLIWMSQYTVGNYEYTLFSEERIDASFYADAHTREDGIIADVIYLPMYRGSYDGTRLRSISGQQPMHSQTATTEMARAKANGAGWNMKSWSQKNLMSHLLTLMTRNDNGQAALGNGNLNYIADASVPTHGVLLAGTLNDKGAFFGYNDNTHQVKAFHQEAPWADQWERILGLINVNGKVKAKMTPPYNLTGEGYDDTGVTMSGTSGGYIKDTETGRFGRIPQVVSGSSTTYTCDGGWFNNGIVAVGLVGGRVDIAGLSGPWAVYVSALPVYAGDDVGASHS
ncbi:hypothetical protein [Eubacterium limosum]|uniref:hypothetical protein n=1 Tax=Eubacterium limosum TaxID=1736 RepID=UPI0010640BCB|nr:hypothetical protein [Eubacterium limosum]